MDQFTFDDLDAILHQVGENANEEWKIAAGLTVRVFADRGQEFTADDVWDVMERLPYETHDNRALGAIMRSAQRTGVIVNTGTFARSRRRHKAPIPIWRAGE